VTLRDPLPKRKPEARAGGISVNGTGDVAEALEDPLMIFGRDTNPGIRDADFRSAVGRGLCAPLRATITDCPLGVKRTT
jgi:hypothetical protein